MSTVQLFSCPRCNRGEFRSLPGADGKAFCPWCGDAVNGGSTPPPEFAPPTPTPPPETLPPTATPPPIDETPVLRERVTTLTRRVEQTESELRQEQERRQGIKKVVLEEVGRLKTQLAESQAALQAKDSEFFEILAEQSRLKEDLEKERKRAAELDSLQKSTSAVQAELEARRREVDVLQKERDAARQDAAQQRADLARIRSAAEKELGELRRKLAESEGRMAGLGDAPAQLKELKTRLIDTQKRLDKERAEGEKKDQRIRDLQLLIQTLGVRLNELSKRHGI